MNKKATKPSKKAIVEAKAELEQLAADKAKLTARETELRHKIADFFHTGEDGTNNTEVHGHKVTVTRRLDVSFSKDEKARLEEENPELYGEIFEMKETLNKTKAKKKVDELEEYATTKQGLPTIKIVATK